MSNELEKINQNRAIIDAFLASNGGTSHLTQGQKAELVRAISSHYGLNPALIPFNFIAFQGREVLYLTKNGCDQIANLRNLSRRIIEKHLDAETLIYTVSAQVSDAHRTDEASASVFIGKYNEKKELIKLSGLELANKLMACESKAKRRATLAFIGFAYEEDAVEDYESMKEIVKSSENKTKEIISTPVETVQYYNNTNVEHKKMLVSILEKIDTNWKDNANIVAILKEFVARNNINLAKLEQEFFAFANEKGI